MSDYVNISDLFNKLNRNNCEYLILRNYENLLKDEIYVNGHGDIDMLCRDVKQVVDCIGAKPFHPKRGNLGDNIHFYINYRNKKVSIDIRSVGDNYYCEDWENDMLKTRVQHECFYVMNEENLLYSLIYHAIFQKPTLSTEYQQKISSMLGKDKLSEDEMISLLERYMQKMGYKYVYAKDFHVSTRKCMHNKSLCDFNWKEYLPHLIFEKRVEMIAFLVKVKHLLIGLTQR